MNRSSLIKQIHTVAYRDLSLDEATYRSVVAGANDRERTSCSDLETRELELVLTALRQFPVGRQKSKPAVNEKQHNMIARLMETLDWRWSQTAKLCKRLTGWDDTRKCSAAELRKVILAMVAMIEQNHASGKRTLSHTELFEFRRHTKHMKEESDLSTPLTESGILQ